MQIIGISRWAEAIEIAKRILWMGETFEIRADNVKVMFELSIVH